MNLTLVEDSTPELEPLSVSEAKKNLRLETDEDNDSIQGMILAARLEAENENGREMSKKQWILALDRFPTGLWCGKFLHGGRYYVLGTDGTSIGLLDPLVSVDSFTYRKADGTTVTLTPNEDYIADTNKHPGIVCPAFGKYWPTDELWPSSAIQITFTAGHDPQDNPAPATIKQGMQLLVAQWYEQRIPYDGTRFIGELPFSVTSLFRNNRLWRF